MSDTPSEATGLIRTNAAPKPVGAYPHARRVGDFIFVSGMGPRQAGTDAIPGGPIKDADGIDPLVLLLSQGNAGAKEHAAITLAHLARRAAAARSRG